MAETHSVVFLVAGLAMVFVVHVLVLMWALKWWRLQAQGPSGVGKHAEEGGGLSSEEVGELPCHERKEGAGGGECAVCLEPFRAGEQRRVLPRCGHGFHAECVDSWLCKSRRCPICRGEAVEQRNDAGAVAEAAATVEIVTESGR